MLSGQATASGDDGADDRRRSKTELRDRLVRARSRRTAQELGEVSHALADQLTGLAEVRRAATVAAYVSVATEPGTGVLLERLRAAGKRILLPCVLPDLDLDWALDTGEGGLAPARHGLREPTSPRLGVDAIAGADALLVPGMAVDERGVRLGKGGGSYDRALSRVPAGTFSCVLLYADEIGLQVPVEPHDRAVSAAVTEVGLHRFDSAR